MTHARRESGKPADPYTGSAGPRPPGPVRRLRDRGASPIELAILMPVTIVALFLSIQFAVYFLASNAALAAAQEGATAAAGYGAAPGAGTAAASDFLAHSQGWMTGATVTQDPAAPGPGAVTVTVRVRGTVLAVLPFLSMPRVDRSANATIEQTTAPD